MCTHNCASYTIFYTLIFITSLILGINVLSKFTFLSSHPLQLSSGKAGVLATKVLAQCRSQLSSDEEVASLWSGASLEWSALEVALEDIGEFLSAHVRHEHCQP